MRNKIIHRNEILLDSQINKVKDIQKRILRIRSGTIKSQMLIFLEQETFKLKISYKLDKELRRCRKVVKTLLCQGRNRDVGPIRTRLCNLEDKMEDILHRKPPNYDYVDDSINMIARNSTIEIFDKNIIDTSESKNMSVNSMCNSKSITPVFENAKNYWNLEQSRVIINKNNASNVTPHKKMCLMVLGSFLADSNNRQLTFNSKFSDAIENKVENEKLKYLQDRMTILRNKMINETNKTINMHHTIPRTKENQINTSNTISNTSTIFAAIEPLIHIPASPELVAFPATMENFIDDEIDMESKKTIRLLNNANVLKVAQLLKNAHRYKITFKKKNDDNHSKDKPTKNFTRNQVSGISISNKSHNSLKCLKENTLQESKYQHNSDKKHKNNQNQSKLNLLISDSIHSLKCSNLLETRLDALKCIFDYIKYYPKYLSSVSIENINEITMKLLHTEFEPVLLYRICQICIKLGKWTTKVLKIISHTLVHSSNRVRNYYLKLIINSNVENIDKKMPLYEDLIYNIKYIFKKSILIAIKTHDSTNINEKLLVNTSRVLCKFSHEYDESIQFLYNQLEQNISYSKKNKILISLVEHLSHFTPKLFQSLVNQINHATSPDYRKKAFDMLNLYDISQLKLLMEENTNEYQILVSRMYDEPDVKVRQEASYIFYRTEMYRTIKENAIKNLQSESPITRENAIICLESLGIVDKIILKAISELAQLDPVKSVRENASKYPISALANKKLIKLKL